jgi:hypothetical protein
MSLRQPHGTVSLPAGIDHLTGQVRALVKDRHRGCEFIEFLQLLDVAYPARASSAMRLRIALLDALI